MLLSGRNSRNSFEDTLSKNQVFRIIQDHFEHNASLVTSLDNNRKIKIQDMFASDKWDRPT